MIAFLQPSNLKRIFLKLHEHDSENHAHVLYTIMLMIF